MLVQKYFRNFIAEKPTCLWKKSRILCLSTMPVCVFLIYPLIATLTFSLQKDPYWEGSLFVRKHQNVETFLIFSEISYSERVSYFTSLRVMCQSYFQNTCNICETIGIMHIHIVTSIVKNGVVPFKVPNPHLSVLGSCVGPPIAVGMQDVYLKPMYILMPHSYCNLLFCCDYNYNEIHSVICEHNCWAEKHIGTSYVETSWHLVTHITSQFPS